MSKDLTEALAALTEQANAQPREAMATRGAAVAVKSSALLPGRSASGGGADMTETAYADRTWHSAVMLPSSDGILFARLVPAKTVKFQDTGGRTIVIEFKAPT